MPAYTPTDEESRDVPIDADCGCSPLLGCWTHVRDDERGRPAIRRAGGDD